MHAHALKSTEQYFSNRSSEALRALRTRSIVKRECLSSSIARSSACSGRGLHPMKKYRHQAGSTEPFKSTAFRTTGPTPSQTTWGDFNGKLMSPLKVAPRNARAHQYHASCRIRVWAIGVQARGNLSLRKSDFIQLQLVPAHENPTSKGIRPELIICVRIHSLAANQLRVLSAQLGAIDTTNSCSLWALIEILFRHRIALCWTLNKMHHEGSGERESIQANWEV